MVILVTGGAGYIGSHICVKLLEKGEELVIVDNFCNSKPEVLEKIKEITKKDFKFYEVDLFVLRKWNKRIDSFCRIKRSRRISRKASSILS